MVLTTKIILRLCVCVCACVKVYFSDSFIFPPAVTINREKLDESCWLLFVRGREFSCARKLKLGS